MKTRCSFHSLSKAVKRVIPGFHHADRQAHRAQQPEQRAEMDDQPGAHTVTTNGDQTHAAAKACVLARAARKVQGFFECLYERSFDILFAVIEFILFAYVIYTDGLG